MFSHEKFYKDNQKYTKFLENQDSASFQKYVDAIKKFTPEKGSFLDCGCGTGIALKLLPASLSVKGVDISKTSIKSCIKHGLDCKVYDGAMLPFKGNSFDCVGSINVLEHTDSPTDLLDEKLRVLKSGGHLIVVCPNFLSITNNYHHHTAGFKQKLKNTVSTIKRSFSSEPEFGKMKTIVREVFQSDDDACNVTNPADIFNWASSKNLERVYWSGRTVYGGKLPAVLDHSLMKLFLGSSFIVFRKN